MKKVMLVIASLGGGGAERAISQLADALVAEGVEVHLVTWAGATFEDFYSVDPRVHRYDLHTGKVQSGLVRRVTRGLLVVFKLRRLMRSLLPDCVLSFIDQSNILTLMAAMGLTTRVIVAERIDPRVNNTLGRAWILARFLVYQRAQLVLAQTKTVAEWMARHWRVKTTVIPNFLRLMPEPTNERTPCIVSVGRLVPQKAFDLSIRAFGLIAAKHPDWRYVILGDGPCREEWMELCNELDLTERVRFEGVVENVEHWLAHASICVQPSRFEGFPNAVMEAMAMGVATISTDCRSGPADLIEHMHDGILVPTNDVEAIAHAMDKLMSNEALRVSLGLRAMSVRERLSCARIMQKWNQVLFEDSLAVPLISNGAYKNIRGEER